MDDKSVPYIVYEGAQARQERTVKRLVSVIVICVILLFVSNAIWLYAWTQYDYTNESSTTSIVQDGRGINVIGNDNEVNDGTENDY